MRRFVLALLALLSAPLVMGAADPGAVTLKTMTQADRDELDAISAYLNGIVTLKGGFVQVSPNGEMSDGLFYLSKPGKLRFQYNPPVPTLVVSDGHWVAVANRRLKTIDRYQPEKRKQGWNTTADGERFYFIPTPSAGLWATRHKLFNRPSGFELAS